MVESLTSAFAMRACKLTTSVAARPTVDDCTVVATAVVIGAGVGAAAACPVARTRSAAARAIARRLVGAVSLPRPIVLSPPLFVPEPPLGVPPLDVPPLEQATMGKVTNKNENAE
jgi:hypothetical protein